MMADYKMLQGAFVLVFGVKWIVSGIPTLLPKFNTVWENESLQLTCYAPGSPNFTRWSIDEQRDKHYAYITKNEGNCTPSNFLENIEYYETKCFNNASFKVKLKRVSINNHKQNWLCASTFEFSNMASIYVQVPIENVTIENGPVLTTVEKKKHILTCVTSEGRPSANITWVKVPSKNRKMTEITNVSAYNIDTNESLTEKNLTIVTSSINIEVVKEDNGSSIICEATNRESHVVKKQIEILVYYSPEEPKFFVDGHVVKDSVCFISGKNMSIACKSESFPSPSYIWSSSGRSVNSQYLNLTTLARSETWLCAATNNMTLSNGTTVTGKSSANLTIHLQCTPILSPEFDQKINISSTRNVNITFKFKVIAHPKPEFRWSKLSNSEWINLENNNKYSITSVDNYSNLTIRSITEGDYGIYKLEIKNDVGSLEQLFFLKANESSTLSEKTIHYWIYVTFTCGGVIIILTVFIISLLIRKRWIKHQSTNTAIYQNVPFPETNTIYLNIPSPVNARFTVEEVGKASEERKEKLKKKRESQNQENVDLNGPLSDQEQPEYSNTLALISNIQEMNITELYGYVKSRTDAMFSVDFQKIPTTFPMSCSFAQKQENIALNRYKGILPYDLTRVCIDDHPEVFINASYIDGYHISKAYIACLGPTAATHDNFKTFWKMVWHEKSELIVMVTNLNEPSGMKCEQYWPDASQDEKYDDILVSCKETEMFAEYTLMTLEVSTTINSKKHCRRVVHLHYTAWPDKQTPEDVISLLEFRKRFQDIREKINSPVIVHCSAGIGRTGVFIAIDRLIMEGKTKGSVNVDACITKMREQRVKMVQTSEQYKFIYQTLVYALNCDCDPIPIESLKHLAENYDETFFTKQYREMTMTIETERKDQIDGRENNKNITDKNRRSADIPDNAKRVYLHLNRSYEDSGYINAVYINSYKCKDHFIMAQSPLPDTEYDFLTMIVQENCLCVVSMEDWIENGMKIGKYILNDQQQLDIGRFTVSCIVNDTRPQYTVRKVTIRDKDKSTCEWHCYHFQYKTWTDEDDTPENAEEFLEFVKNIQDYARNCDDGLHVLAHCLRANERSGLFCAIAIIMEKLLLDEEVSVLNTLRHLRTRNPSAITSKEQLKFCYEVAAVFAKMQSKGMYINVQ